MLSKRNSVAEPLASAAKLALVQSDRGAGFSRNEAQGALPSLEVTHPTQGIVGIMRSRHDRCQRDGIRRTLCFSRYDKVNTKQKGNAPLKGPPPDI